MDIITQNNCLVSLSLASNDLTGEGIGYIFDSMCLNESIIDLNISTINGANRNRLSKGYSHKLYKMLVGNKILERLDISGINLGNHGFN